MARPAVNVIASGKAWQHGFIGGKKPIFANKSYKGYKPMRTNSES
jgi:hypothetical protein